MKEVEPLRTVTMRELMEDARLRAGAQNFKGHDFMDLARFDEKTRHMIIFDVLTHNSRVGFKGDRMRLFLSETGYEPAGGAGGRVPLPWRRLLRHLPAQTGPGAAGHPV